MKIGLISSVGRNDKYGYQYNEFNKLFINNLASFSDHFIVISTSKYSDKELYKHSKIEYISNEKTWFNLENGRELFSFEIFNRNLNYCMQKLKDYGYDIALAISITNYIPKSSIEFLKKHCLKMLRKEESYTHYYKRYLCGNLLFNADIADPFILNLKVDEPWKIGVDSCYNNKTGKIARINSGNFKKFNKMAIVDVPWELTLQDAKEKSEFTIAEYRKQNNTYDPSKPELFQFNEKEWLNYHQFKINRKKLSNDKLDKIGERINELRKENFISHILEKNYKYSK